MCQCAICGRDIDNNDENSWFLVVGNRWRDSIKILQWERHVAGQDGVLKVCSTDHVRELVVHWMTTGSLDYPFAHVPNERKPPVRRSRRREWQALPPDPEEVDISRAQQIGELAIHRESLQRVLRESPEILETMIEALLEGLERRPALSRASSKAETARIYLVPQEV